MSSVVGEIKMFIKQAKLTLFVGDNGTGKSKTMRDIFKSPGTGTCKYLCCDKTHSISYLQQELSSENLTKLFFIENPEVYLSEQKQVEVAEIMLNAVQEGFRLVVETHSCFIFNRLRIALCKDRIKKEDVRVYFFEPNNITEIQFLNYGRVLNSKKGFFDQFDNDLLELI